MKKTVIAVVLAGLSLGMIGKAAGQEAGRMQERRGQFFARQMIRELNLTDAQRASIRAILQKEKPAIQSLAAEMLQENEQLRSKNAFDETLVRSVAQQRSGTLTEALVEKEKVRAEIFAVLTPAQQQKANQMADEMRAKIRDRIVNLGDQF
ncbi:MAG TPA: Spy/CpxP family protein refolding chaperone [Candidatus Acidoferrales bacterium]